MMEGKEHSEKSKCKFQCKENKGQRITKYSNFREKHDDEERRVSNVQTEKSKEVQVVAALTP